ncbi:endoplasmic reticulum-derived transport vesicle ERV46 [Rhizoctonia solani AG-1 IA]|uniref:Endoplasmic reticulum-derived transport vesicle ERV46 n=1 Tax=Thanatephorus cucumeris (strain AG1-IA) TaxID=983506 RepID=L8WSC3_THACA|nr:endoplasmic reticulum-derived transport vesicle ERV46 [Rhizoctonia solani AG-1 IA]
MSVGLDLPSGPRRHNIPIPVYILAEVRLCLPCALYTYPEPRSLFSKAVRTEVVVVKRKPLGARIVENLPNRRFKDKDQDLANRTVGSDRGKTDEAILGEISAPGCYVSQDPVDPPRMPVALRCVLSSSYHQALLYLPASISANNMARGLLRAYVGLDGFGKLELEQVDSVGKPLRENTLYANRFSVTLISMGIILIFTIIEIIDYRRIGMASDIIVDVSRGEQISVNMNITFPRVPCYLLSLDITDVSGDIQQDVSHHILKTRLEPSGAMIHENTLNYRIKSETGISHQGMELRRPEHDRAGMLLLELIPFKEPHPFLRINKVTGNFHFSPGRSFLSQRGHAYDLVPYLKDGNHHDFGHYIHEFHFEGDREIEDRWREGNRGTEWRARVGSDKQPLDGLEQPSNWMIQYFLKVVSTEVRHLDGDLVRAHQYSVTNYERDIRPGHEFDPLRDANGIKTTHGLCAIVGGVLTLASIADSVAFASLNKIEETNGHGSTNGNYMKESPAGVLPPLIRPTPRILSHSDSPLEQLGVLTEFDSANCSTQLRVVILCMTHRIIGCIQSLDIERRRTRGRIPNVITV